MLRVLLIASLVANLYAAFECGVPHFQIVERRYANSRIVGGWEARPHSIPWQVYVMTFKPHSKMYGACGGSLIQFEDKKNCTDLVLSAAHCVEKNMNYAEPRNVKIVVGAHEIFSDKEESQREIPIKDFRHHTYVTSQQMNDIALFKLKVVVPYTKYTRPVCLPKSTDTLPRDAQCFVSGWGRIGETDETSKLLRMVDVEVYSDSKCNIQEHMRKYMFCAGHEKGGKDSCQGDSGGPLVCKQNGRWVQYGVVSFGSGCARAGHPGMYANLPSYISWLKSMAKELEKAHDFSPLEKPISYYKPPTTTARPTIVSTAKPSSHTSNNSPGNNSLTSNGQSSLPYKSPFPISTAPSVYKPTGQIKPGHSHSFSGIGNALVSSPHLTNRPAPVYSGSTFFGSKLPSSSTLSGRPTPKRPMGVSRF